MAAKKPAYFGNDLEAMSFAKNYHRWIVDEFHPALGTNVAEIGAGVGNFSEFLLDAGVKYLAAFEPSENMYPHLAKKFAGMQNVRTYNNLFEETSERFIEYFDAAVYVNVLEHIENDVEALSHAFKTLRPGGRLLVFVPALQWLYSELDYKVGHFRRYHRSQLIQTIEAAGFCVKTAKYFDIMGIIPWYFAFVVLKQTASATNVSSYDRLIVPITRRLEQSFSPPVGKNLLVIAHKE